MARPLRLRAQLFAVATAAFVLLTAVFHRLQPDPPQQPESSTSGAGVVAQRDDAAPATVPGRSRSSRGS